MKLRRRFVGSSSIWATSGQCHGSGSSNEAPAPAIIILGSDSDTACCRCCCLSLVRVMTLWAAALTWTGGSEWSWLENIFYSHKYFFNHNLNLKQLKIEMTICVFNHQLLAKQAHLTFSTSIHRRHAAGPEDLGRGSNQCGAGVAECDGSV